MEREIERKFLVKDTSFISLSRQSLCIQQAYLSKDPARIVRVRISNDQGWITIKGKSDSSGLSRLEWEKEIPLEEAKELLLLCTKMIQSEIIQTFLIQHIGKRATKVLARFNMTNCKPV